MLNFLFLHWLLSCLVLKKHLLSCKSVKKGTLIICKPFYVDSNTSIQK